MPAAAQCKTDFLTVVEAAKELQISERSLRYLIAAGEVRARRLGKRIIRIPRREIERLADTGCSAFCTAGVSNDQNNVESD